MKKRKYTILERINKLPHSDYIIAKNKLPIALGVSKRTFERWMYLLVDDKLEVPADKLAMIAKYFDCPIEKLFNYKIPQYNIKKLKALEESQFIRQLNLVK